MRKGRNALMTSLMCISIGIAAWSTHAVADDVPLVDGNIWAKSSHVEKTSYIVGISNFISLEYAYQSKAKTPPTRDQSSVPDFFNKTDNVTLDEAIGTVDQWFKSHPDEMDKPVLDVIWTQLVEPNL